ncbi:probable G-protein coupled receptor Mth-like 2 [Penaeus vannamei]|uniref:probable G-protein coupled receptor Mth-like 2 n=1 Tax=Penaeus vannamei TaxID=6689 RepID=UPI00387F604D
MFLLRLGLLLPALTLGTTHASGASGRRCCEEGKGCAGGGIVDVFEPPVSPSLDVSWSFHPLQCPEGYRKHQVDIEEDSLVTRRASLELRWMDVFWRRTTEFCVAVNFTGKYIAFLCRPDVQKVCKTKHCVQMCCAEGNFLRDRECVRSESPPGTQADDLHFVVSTPKCDSSSQFLTARDFIDGENEFNVSGEGALSFSSDDDSYEIGRYCLARDENGTTDRAIYCARQLSELLQQKNQAVKICLIVSCVFLALTILNHGLTKKLRDVQGLCFLFHMMSLLVADAALICSTWFSKHISLTHCIINGFILQYSFLATFAWINVMCFDIWRVVKATVSLVPLSDILASDAKKFRIYCALAFGLPLAIVAVTVVLQVLPASLLHENSFFRPNLGVGTCWFPGYSGRLLYFFGPIGVFSVASLAFLGHTLAMLLQTGSVCTCCSKKAPVTAFNRNHLEAFWQRFSLFCVSVLCWVTEFLSFLIQAPEIWIVTDIINSLQGVIVFFIFITSKKKRRIVFQSWESTVSSVVSRASKTFSRTDSAGSAS